MAKRIWNVAEGRKNRATPAFYQLSLPFSYTALWRGHRVRGWGKTIELNGRQIRVAPIGLPPGIVAEMSLSIAWPARLEDGTCLQMLADVLPEPGPAADLFRILRHDFRTVARTNRVSLSDACRTWKNAELERLAGEPAWPLAAVAGGADRALRAAAYR